MSISDDLVEAARDLRYLLSRGYNRESAVRFVGDKHKVSSQERYVLFRGVYDEAEAKNRRKKTVGIGDIVGQIVSVDGYNLLITVESMLARKPLIRCDDYITRDISGVFGKHKITTRTREALSMIVKEIKAYNPKEAHFFYDKQVSRSGELASMTRRMLEEFDLSGTATTAQKSDVATVRSGGILVSSDSVVVQKARKILDLAGILASQRSYDNIIQLGE